MSVARPILNMWLRLIEKRHLTHAKDANSLRHSFETKARLFFHGPRGTTQNEITLAGRPAIDLHLGKSDGPLVLYFHGGGYVFGSPRTHAAMVAYLCKHLSGRAILPDYRKAPEDPHPAAIKDAEAAYLALLDHGHDPARIVIGGDSAGGGLALSLIAVLLAKGHPLPAGAFAFSPLTDMTYSGASVKNNAQSDVVLPASRVLEMTEAFLGDGSRDDPLVSPLYADFKGAPPIWLTVGDTEILLDDTTRMAETLTAQGVSVQLKIERDLPHVWPLFHNLLPEARASLRAVAAWIQQKTS